MRIVTFLVLFTAMGLIAGYLVYGRINDEYINPAQIFVKREGVVGWGIKKLYGLEEKRKQILIAGAIGGVAGLFLGAVTGKTKTKSENPVIKNSVHAYPLDQIKELSKLKGKGSITEKRTDHPVLRDSVRANPLDLIGELAKMKEKGIVTEEEFQAKKKELLTRL